MCNGGLYLSDFWQGSHSLEKSMNFREVLEFSSTLNVAAWKVFFDAFWLSKTEYES